MLYFSANIVLEETHSKWHMVTDYNGVWRRQKVMQSPNFGRSFGFTATFLPKFYLIDENNLSCWTFINETLQTLNNTHRGEIPFSYLHPYFCWFFPTQRWFFYHWFSLKPTQLSHVLFADKNKTIFLANQ